MACMAAGSPQPDRTVLSNGSDRNGSVHGCPNAQMDLVMIRALVVMHPSQLLRRNDLDSGNHRCLPVECL
jgi:hypothetical protein